MIEINLLKEKKTFVLPVVIGIDLNLINYRLVGIAMGFVFLSGIIASSIFGQIEDNVKSEIEVKKKQFDALRKSNKENQKIITKIENLKKKESILQKMDKLANQLIRDKKSNPQKILLRIANDIPDDLWLKNLDITPERKVRMTGESSSYKSIGNFLSDTNDSIFFGKSLEVKNLTTVEDEMLKDGSRVESFEITGEIKQFDIESIQ